MEIASIRCAECEHRNEACIADFYIENPFGYTETLYLLQCERCGAFTVVTWEDSWDDGHWYYAGPYTAEQAEIIFLFFRACDGYKQCRCEVHEAVRAWVLPPQRTAIFDRQDLIDTLKANPDYPQWCREWGRATGPAA